MTYLEIIEWIENNECEVWQNLDKTIIDYYCKKIQEYMTVEGKDLISIVLEINNKELIK